MNGICEYLILKIFFRNGICVSTNGIIPSVLLFCVCTNLFFCENYAKCAAQKSFNVKRMIIVCTQRSFRRKNRTFVSHNWLAHFCLKGNNLHNRRYATCGRRHHNNPCLKGRTIVAALINIFAGEKRTNKTKIRNLKFPFLTSPLLS